MKRSLYRFILGLHPPAFRRRFSDEMLSIFDEKAACQAGFTLLLDALISFARQWLLRTGSWKIPVAIGGAFIQVWGFGYRIKGYRSWTENHQALTPYLNEVILITLAVVCSLIVTTISLALWTVRFQRRRSEGRRAHFSGLSAARHPARSRLLR